MTPRRSDANYVPSRLRHFVFHSQDDFYVSRHFDPLLVSHLMYEGFLPIASDYQDTCLLLPKLHRQRCVLLIQPTAPAHVPKIVRKRSKKYTFVLNRDFDGVVAGCHEQHGIPWLYPPIVESFKTLFQAGDDGMEFDASKKVRFFTVELYDLVTDTLVAGELGYTVGSVYTSLTGFSRVSGAGSVQLHALSKFLYLAGFKMWDLGMSMDYKVGLGAINLDRDEFLSKLYKWRSQEVLMRLDESINEEDVRTGVLARALFDNTRLPNVTAAANTGKSMKEEASKDAKQDAERDAIDETLKGGTKRRGSSAALHIEEQSKPEVNATISKEEASDRSVCTQ